MAYDRAERRMLTLLFFVIGFLWILFGFFWSILLVFTFLVLAFTFHRDENQGKRETVSGGTRNDEEEDFYNDGLDAPFTDALRTKCPGNFTLKSPRPLLSEVTRTLNYNVSRVSCPIPDLRLSKGSHLSRVRRRSFGNNANESAWRQSPLNSPAPFQGNASFGQPRSPSYFSVLNQAATVRIAPSEFANRSFVNMENTSINWKQRHWNPCSRDTVLSALRGVRKRSVLDEDEDAENLKLRKKSRYSKCEKDEPMIHSPSNVGVHNGTKRSMLAKTQDEDVDDVEEDNARKKMRSETKKTNSEGTRSSGENQRQKRRGSESTVEQLKRAPVQHSTPLVSSEKQRSKRKKVTGLTQPEELRTRALPIKDSDIVMVETCDDKTESLKAAQAEKKPLATASKQGKSPPKAENAASPLKEDKAGQEESHKKQLLVVRKDDPRRRSVPVYCASSDGIDLPLRRQTPHRINQEHVRHDRKAAWERVKWLLDDDEDEDEDKDKDKEPKTAVNSTAQSQNAPQGVPSTVSLPVLGLRSTASSAVSAVQPPLGLVTLGASASTSVTSTQQVQSVGQVPVSSASTVSNESVTTVETNKSSNLSSADSTVLPSSLNTVLSQAQTNAPTAALPISLGKAVTMATQSLLAPVTSVPQVSSGFMIASQGALGASSSIAPTNVASSTSASPAPKSLSTVQPIAFGSTQVAVASFAPAQSASSSGFNFVKTTPSSSLGSSVVQGSFNFSPSVSSSTINPVPQSALGLGQAGNSAFATPAASIHNPLGSLGSSTNVLSASSSSTSQATFGMSTTTSQSTFGPKTNPTQSPFASTFKTAQNVPVSSSNAAQSAFGSVPSASQNTLGSNLDAVQNAFGSTVSSTQNALGANSNSTQNAFGSTFKSPQNILGASSTQNTFGANSVTAQNVMGVTPTTTQNAFGVSSNPTQGVFGAGSTQSAFGSSSNHTQNAFGASSNTSHNVFGSNANASTSSQSAFGSAPNSTQNAFGSVSKNTFGSSSNTTQNAFGSAASAAQKAFGATQNAFGSSFSPAQNTFGTSTPKPNFTQSAFGANQSNQGAFGAGSANQNTFTFASGSTNQTSVPQNTFGSSSSQTVNSLAGGQAANSPFKFGAQVQSGFGSSPSQQVNTGLAGSQTTTNSPFKFGGQMQSGFGSAQSSTQSAFGSGTSQNAVGSTGGFNFGEAAKQSSGGFNFAPNSSTTGGFQFGPGSRPGTPAPSGGFSFGASPGSGVPGSPSVQSTSANPGSVAAQRQRARILARRRGKK